MVKNLALSEPGSPAYLGSTYYVGVGRQAGRQVGWRQLKECLPKNVGNVSHAYVFGLTMN